MIRRIRFFDVQIQNVRGIHTFLKRKFMFDKCTKIRLNHLLLVLFSTKILAQSKIAIEILLKCYLVISIQKQDD